MMPRPFPVSPWEGLDIPSAVLLGIQRDPRPPLLFGPHRLERLRIVIIDRDPSAGEMEEAEEDGADDDTEILPQIPLDRFRPPTPARPVQGEILRGEDGTLYERFGHRIRPLNALASGPRGEVLEIAASPVVKPADDSRRNPKGDGAVVSETPPDPENTAIRPLFAAPGHWRVVQLGEFRPMLSPQLAQPARLRDAHWLPCHVQVFECPPPQTRETLAAAALGDARHAAQLAPLTPQLAHALQLAAVLPPPMRGTVRFLHLRLAHDPTGQEPRDQTPAPAETPAAAPQTAAAPATAAPAPKTGVPNAFAQNAPYVLSRDDAYADLMADDRAFAHPLRRWFRRSAPVAPAALRDWQLQLSGRSGDEQLWAVPPPAGWRRDSAVLGWAAQTLERNGYSPAVLPEWRLYWRRRGC